VSPLKMTLIKKMPEDLNRIDHPHRCPTTYPESSVFWKFKHKISLKKHI